MQSLSLFNELSEQIILTINACNHEFHGGFWLESKIHQDYDIWMITSGRVEIQTCDLLFSASAGDIVFFYPDCLYTASTHASGCSFIYIHFDFFIGNQGRMLDGMNLCGITGSQHIQEEARFLFDAFSAHKSKQDLSAMYFKGCFMMLIAKLIMLNNNDLKGSRFPVGQSQRDAARKLTALEPVFLHINKHLTRALSMQELAACANLSEKYFITYFRTLLGITPGQFVNRLRMNRAREYIYEKTHSVKEISALLGYADLYTFSKAFKRFFNVSPSQFI